VSWQFAGVLLGGVATLAVYSFLWKENPFYRFFEHVFVGLGVGYGVAFTWTGVLEPKLFLPLFAVDLKPGEAYWWEPLLLLPAAFGCLYYFIYSRKRQWLARLVIGFSLGIGGGMAFRGFFNEQGRQILMSFRPVVQLVRDDSGAMLGWASLWASLGNVAFIAALFCVMTYFFFSFEHDKPVIKQASAAGRWFLMVTFGAFFGATVMARMSLLIERLQFLINEWLAGIYHFLTFGFGG